jgi:type II secretory pathway pseudopilin PulG
MKSGRTNRRSCAARPACAGFTLAEVLAALVFMAIVIPVAVQGLRIASLAGQVAERKAVAARIADRMLNELVVTGQWQTSNQSGSRFEGVHEFTWRAVNDPWELGVLRVLNVEVFFQVQGQEYDVRLSTLIDPSAELATTNSTTTAAATEASQ